MTGLLQLFLFQCLGELIQRVLLPVIPGPVIGMVLLLIFLLLYRRVPEAMATTSALFSQNLGILFVPAAVGVVLYFAELRTHGLAVFVVLLASVVLTMLATALVLVLWPSGGRQLPAQHPDQHPETHTANKSS